MYYVLDSTIFQNSSILTQELSVQLLKTINLPTNKDWKMIYQASRHGMKTSTFHSMCNGLFGTLTVFKTANSFIFGGYTQADWSGYGINKNDPNAFLFSLINAYNESFRLNVTRPENAIFCSDYTFPSFGTGSDLYVSETYSYSYLGFTYMAPFDFTYATVESQTFLAGSRNFQPIEIEVYY
jgi:hypothetical protein